MTRRWYKPALFLSHITNTRIFSHQVQSEFILESERESFIEQVREVIENADEKGLERDTNSQVITTLSLHCFLPFSGR